MIIRWLLPLGFIGLVAIAVLLVIYLIRPQYKAKRISGTKIWKRVLSHSKKQRLVLSNIFIFFVQALVLAIIAVGFAQPRIYSKEVLASDVEYVMIIDSSASMRAKSLTDGTTRFERAVNLIKEEISDFYSQTEGAATVIIAGKTPTYLFTDLKEDSKSEAFNMLDNASCSLEESDLESAIKFAGNRLESNPYTKIFLYTDTQFGDLGTAVSVINVADRTNEQNIAILGCNVGIVDNEYVFEVILGAYGDITRKCNMSVDIKGADNGKEKKDFHLEVPVTFAVDEKTSEQEQRVSVKATNSDFGGQNDWFFDSYDQVKIYFPNLEDSITDDNQYYVYSGIRDVIKTEYWSNKSNTFWQFGFNNLANNMRSYRDISFREIYHDQGMKAENFGYDFYIFEHSIPEEILQSGLPKDGIVLLVDPDNTLNQTGLGLSFEERVTLENLTPCTSAEDHPLTKYMDFKRINLTQYTRLSIDGESEFKPLLYLDNNPIMLVKNTQEEKCVVLPFSINMSDFYGEQFQIFLYNLLNYFAPTTLSKADFNLGEEALLNCKGRLIKVEHNDVVKTVEEFPSNFTFDDVGTYVFTTEFGLEKASEVRRAYAHISTLESKLFSRSEFHATLDNKELSGESGKDFFIWLAIASLILIIIEWFLQFKYIL